MIALTTTNNDAQALTPQLGRAQDTTTVTTTTKIKTPDSTTTIIQDTTITSGTSSAGAGGATSDAPKDLIATAKQAPNYTTFLKLLDLAHLTSTLEGSAEFTVFAPTDEAFGKLPKELMDTLQSDTTRLKQILLYHVVSGKFSANKILDMRNAKTLAG